MLSDPNATFAGTQGRLGLTVRRLGEISGVHYVAVVRLEAGKLDPRLSTLLKLCKALGVTLNDLVKHPKGKGAYGKGLGGFLSTTTGNGRPSALAWAMPESGQYTKPPGSSRRG